TTRALRFIIAISSTEAVATVTVVGRQAVQFRVFNVRTRVAQGRKLVDETQIYSVTDKVPDADIRNIHPPASVSRIGEAIFFISRISNTLTLEGKKEIRGIVQSKTVQEAKILDNRRVRVIKPDKAQDSSIHIKLDNLTHFSQARTDDLCHHRAAMGAPNTSSVRGRTLWQRIRGHDTEAGVAGTQHTLNGKAAR